MKITPTSSVQFKGFKITSTLTNKNLDAVKDEISKYADLHKVDVVATSFFNRFREKFILLNATGKQTPTSQTLVQFGYLSPEASAKKMLEGAKSTIDEFVKKYF